MTDRLPPSALPALTLAADRLDELAEAAELMGDPDGAARLRGEARANRMHAMELLDDTGHGDLLREAVDGRTGEDPPWPEDS